MADVFISYSMKTAADIARNIADALRERGISCWYAGEHEELGEYPENIVAALEDCRVFLLIMNRAAIHSLDVKSETAIAFNRLRKYHQQRKGKITLIPFRIEDCSLEDDKVMYYYLVLQDIVDGCPPDAEHMRDLIDKIARILNI